MARRARLQELLGKRFADSKELRAFVDDTFGTDAVNSIGWEEGVNDETSDLIRWLESRRRMDELWPALRTAFPAFVTEIDALAAEWKPGPLARFVPGGLLHSRPLQVGIAATVFAIGVVAWFLWFRQASYTVVIVLDGAARDAITAGETFAVEVDGTPYPLTSNGVSIGKGALLPASIKADYRATVKEPEFPTKVAARLTSTRARTIRVTLNSQPCAKQPQIVADDNSIRVVKLEDCKESSVVRSSTPPPKVGVAVSIVDSDGFRRQFQNDLNRSPERRSVEDFLAAQLIEQFNKIGIFEFVPASPSIPASSTLVGRINTEWPNGNVVLRLKLGNEDEQPMTLFKTELCGAPPCAPKNLAFDDWYETVFQDFVRQWPQGFLKSITLTTSAIYETGGMVRTEEDLARFGQVPGGPPKALFDITYGNDRQRTFVLCHAHPELPRKAAGFDVSPDGASCSNRVTTTEPAGTNGRVTLFRVLR